MVEWSEGARRGLARASALFLLLGVVCLVALFGVGLAVGEPTRLFATCLVSGTFLTGVALAGAFFIASHTLGQAGWHVALFRLFEATMLTLPVGLLFLVIAFYDFGHLYHWVEEPIPKKAVWLNVDGFFLRTGIYILLWVVLIWWLHRLSRRLDVPGDLRAFHWLSVASALFIVVFAITESLSAIDWIMSTEPHWYSTLFGWYVFSSYWVGAIALWVLVLVWMRARGIHPYLTDEHIHDMGKYLFGFSIFWTYLFYSQYMLQWYANIPEETKYFVLRVYENAPWFYLLPILNFAVPFFLLMRNEAKRSTFWLTIVALSVLAGHMLDFWLMIYPNVFGAGAPLGWIEVVGLLGALSLFVGVFFWVLRSLAPAPVGHPFFRESLEYHA